MAIDVPARFARDDLGVAHRVVRSAVVGLDGAVKNAVLDGDVQVLVLRLAVADAQGLPAVAERLAGRPVRRDVEPLVASARHLALAEIHAVHAMPPEGRHVVGVEGEGGVADRAVGGGRIDRVEIAPDDLAILDGVAVARHAHPRAVVVVVGVGVVPPAAVELHVRKRAVFRAGIEGDQVGEAVVVIVIGAAAGAEHAAAAAEVHAREHEARAPQVNPRQPVHHHAAERRLIVRVARENPRGVSQGLGIGHGAGEHGAKAAPAPAFQEHAVARAQGREGQQLAGLGRVGVGDARGELLGRRDVVVRRRHRRRDEQAEAGDARDGAPERTTKTEQHGGGLSSFFGGLVPTARPGGRIKNPDRRSDPGPAGRISSSAARGRRNDVRRVGGAGPRARARRHRPAPRRWTARERRRG